MAGLLDRLKSRDVGVDAVFRTAEGSTPFSVITAPDLLGTRIEYVGLDSYEPISEWVLTGRYPGGIGG
jgi:hypothetical protein